MVHTHLGYFTKIYNGDKVNGFSPSVSVLYKSAAKFIGKNAIGIILTGMGNDGAKEMLEMKKAGARTFAQDEKSSVVFGMPNEAYKYGGAERLVSLKDIPNELIKLVS